MANFCIKCGGALDASAGFCRQCGSPVAAGQPPVQNAAPVYNAPPPAAPLPPATSSSSALKFLLIAFLIFAVLGVAGIAGVYYYAKGKVTAKMAEFKEQTGVDVGQALEKAAHSKPSSSERRDGCLMLTKAEAEQILGMPLERVSGRPSANESGEHCEYYAPASAAKASAEQAAERLKQLGKSGSAKSDEANLKDIEGVVKSMGAAMSDGSTPVLVVTIYRGDAQAAILGLNLGVVLGGMKAEKVPGPWDEATMGPLNSLMTVRKGDNGLMIDLRQLPEGREKGIEIAKTVVAKF